MEAGFELGLKRCRELRRVEGREDEDRGPGQALHHALMGEEPLLSLGGARREKRSLQSQGS